MKTIFVSVVICFSYLLSISKCFNWISKLSKIKTYHYKRNIKYFSSLTPVKLDWAARKNAKLNESNVENRFAGLKQDLDVYVTVSEEELLKKWKEMCISTNKLDESDKFSLGLIIPFFGQDDTHIVLQSRLSSHDISTDEIYITEQELHRIWLEASLLPFGKPSAEYNSEDALLLVNDEEDEEILSSISSTDIISLSNSKVLDIDLAPETELYITSDELQRVWSRRSQIPWGLPSSSFDEKLAFLLIDDDEDEQDEYVSVLVSASNADSKDKYSASDRGNFEFSEEGDEDSVDSSTSRIERLVDLMTAELDDRSYIRPAWKKDRHFLTPDVDTQSFMGDIMQGSMHMTSRIPANWADPEQDEMSDIYLSTGTMAMPGEPEVDFNLKFPPWVVLDLPFGKDKPLQQPAAPSASTQAEPAQVDWNTFDFSAADKAVSGPPAAEAALDVDSFFKKMAPATKSSKGYVPEASTLEVEYLGSNTVPAKPESIPWITPKEWLVDPEFSDHVGFEVWGAEKEQAPEWTEEDTHFALSMEHVLLVTDAYLRDHMDLSEGIDDREYWNRQVWCLATGSNETLQPVPHYLTPDLDRGVKYSDEIIEMKGKKTLHAYQPPPAERWANDTFTHNEEIRQVNQIGTIREQYDWQPQGSPEDWEIDPAVVERLGPVLRMANEVAKLRSTKGNVLLFEYRGVMRHIAGIRATLFEVARQCFPEVVDLRLETTRLLDKHDY